MDTWAVIKTGGKQHKVKIGQTLAVEKLAAKGEPITFDQVLLISSGGKLQVGKPLIEKAKVKAKILGDFKDKKIRIVKFKPKSRYLRTTGHRHQKTKVKIEKIES